MLSCQNGIDLTRFGIGISFAYLLANDKRISILKFSVMKTIRRNNLLFPSLMNDLLYTDLLGGTEVPRNRFKPAVNIKETETGFELELIAPGLKKEDFNVEVENELMTISADFEENREENNEGYSRKEYSFRSFKRSFTLPETIDDEAIKADYKDGVLRLSLPKREEALPKPKRLISIK